METVFDRKIICLFQQRTGLHASAVDECPALIMDGQPVIELQESVADKRFHLPPTLVDQQSSHQCVGPAKLGR